MSHAVSPFDKRTPMPDKAAGCFLYGLFPAIIHPKAATHSSATWKRKTNVGKYAVHRPVPFRPTEHDLRGTRLRNPVYMR